MAPFPGTHRAMEIQVRAYRPASSHYADSLTVYAVRQPKKLRPMAKYLATRINREIQRFPSSLQYEIYALNNVSNFVRMVHAGVQAMEKLLEACHFHLYSFVDSYLTVLERLLESNVPDYQVLGTTSVLLCDSVLIFLVCQIL